MTAYDTFAANLAPGKPMSKSATLHGAALAVAPAVLAVIGGKRPTLSQLAAAAGGVYAAWGRLRPGVRLPLRAGAVGARARRRAAAWLPRATCTATPLLAGAGWRPGLRAGPGRRFGRLETEVEQLVAEAVDHGRSQGT